jgi:hypothetical protein
MRPLAALLLLAAACSSGGSPKAELPAPPDASLPVVTADAAVALVVPAEPQESKDHRTIELMLESTPSGATAMVDKTVVGTTPVYYETEFTGSVHEFTFALPGYTTATYCFVPLQNGFVHGRLERIGDSDGGVLEIHTTPCPVAAVAPPPPPRPRVVHRPPPDAAVPDDAQVADTL